MDLAAGFTLAQVGGKAFTLPLGQVVCAVVQSVPDPVERVPGVSAVAQGVLPDATPDLAYRRAGDLDDMERIKHGDCLGQLVAWGVGLAAEQAQSGELHPGSEARRPVGQPGRPCLAGASRDEIQESGVHLSVLARVRSTVPVNIAGTVAADLCGAWCHMCSSTPRRRARPSTVERSCRNWAIDQPTDRTANDPTVRSVWPTAR